MSSCVAGSPWPNLLIRSAASPPLGAAPAATPPPPPVRPQPTAPAPPGGFPSRRPDPRLPLPPPPAPAARGLGWVGKAAAGSPPPHPRHCVATLGRRRY